MCPLNEGKLLEATPEKAAGLRAALKEARAILGAFGLKGFVEPLGFPISSLRFKREALAAIDDVNGADVFSLVHDTFHHRGAGEREVFAARTGLVHISEFGSEEKLHSSLELGKSYTFKITLFDAKEQKMTLSFIDPNKKVE